MSDFNNNISNSTGPGSSAEPSMEEILASIRRILKEDTAAPAKVDIDDDVLLLDASMQAKPADFGSPTELPPEPASALITPHPDAAGATQPESHHFTSEPTFAVAEYAMQDNQIGGSSDDHPLDFTTAAAAPPPEPEPEPAPPPAPPPPSRIEDPMSENVEPPHAMLSEQASTAAANSIGALVRGISNDRAVMVTKGGTTIEDMVREELRPVLKAWLDTNLPGLVERIVRTEIERVIERGTS